MDILEIIKERRSIRKFKSNEIPKEIINKLIEALRWAPSAGNLQSRNFYFVFINEIKEKLAEAAGQIFVKTAPLIIVGCTNNKIAERYGQRGIDLYSICDVASAIENLILLCVNEGLGSCWVGKFDEEKVSRILELPPNLRPIAIIPIGYPGEKPAVQSRLPQEEIAIFK